MEQATSGEQTGRPGGEASTSQRLVEAAAEIFGERGYDGATVTDIARRADLTTGAIYANFRDKAELLLEAIAAVEAAQDANLAEIRQGHDDAAKIHERFLDDVARWVDPALAHDRAFVVESRVACRRDQAVRERLSRQERERVAAVVEVVRSLQAEGLVTSEHSADDLAVLLFSIPLGLTLLELTDVPLPSTTSWRPLVQRLVDTFLLTGTGRDALDEQPGE